MVRSARPVTRRFLSGMALLSLAMLLLSSCDEVAQKKMAKSAVEPLLGQGDLKFGMSFEEATAALPRVIWNGWSVKECHEQFATSGCFLTSDADSNNFPPVEGIPFRPQLSFNRLGKLTDITWVYEQRSAVDISQCEDISRRVIDRMARELGPVGFAEHRLNKSSDRKYEVRSTSTGVKYPISFGDNGKSFIISNIRSHFDPEKDKRVANVDKWNDSAHGSYMGVFMMVDGSPICMARLDYGDRPSVERRAL